jgi:hypothetical protein
MHEFDSPWKEALNDFLRPFLQMFFSDIERLIDWSVTPEVLDGELAKLFPDGAFRKGFVDRLFKVRLLDETEFWLLIHIEVQAQYEADFEERMFRYYIRLKEKLGLPLTCLAVLADERPNWRPHMYQSEFAGTKVIFSFPMVKLADYREKIDELERSENIFALIVLAHLQSQTATELPDRKQWKRRIVQNLMERELHETRRWKALRLIEWLLDLPVEWNEAFWNEIKEWKEGKAMPYITGLEQMLMEKGVQKGREEGREEERAFSLDALELLLEWKFESAGKEFFAALKANPETTRLEAVLQALRQGASLEELRHI